MGGLRSPWALLLLVPSQHGNLCFSKTFGLRKGSHRDANADPIDLDRAWAAQLLAEELPVTTSRLTHRQWLRAELTAVAASEAAAAGAEGVVSLSQQASYAFSASSSDVFSAAAFGQSAEALAEATSAAKTWQGQKAVSAPTVSPAEQNMYKAETAAAEVAGGCVLVLCIVMFWFTSSFDWDDADEERPILGSVLQYSTFFCCCCCRNVTRSLGCFFKYSDGPTALVVLVSLVLFVLSMKQMWDQHLIQPHLEEATVYLLVMTILLVIILLVIGLVVRWARNMFKGYNAPFKDWKQQAKDRMANSWYSFGFGDKDQPLDLHDYGRRQKSSRSDQVKVKQREHLDHSQI